jgi:hypothetical protein
MDMACTLDHALQPRLASPSAFVRKTGRQPAVLGGSAWIRRWPVELARELGVPFPSAATHDAPWPEVISSGHGPLDARLPPGGWKSGQVVEMFTPYAGEAEWSLLEPMLRAVAAHDGPIGLVNLPRALQGATGPRGGLELDLLRPSSEMTIMLASARQSMEAALTWLATHDRGVLVIWATEVSQAAWKALCRAVRRSRSHVFVVRPALARWDESPAALQLVLTSGRNTAAADTLEVRVQARNCPAACVVRLRLEGSKTRGLQARSADDLPLKIWRDPQDERRLVLSGTMAEVCRALERELAHGTGSSLDGTPVDLRAGGNGAL